MYGNGVLVILNNWRRPQNLPTVIQAWQGQSVKPKQVVVVDNSPAQEGRGDHTCPEQYPASHLMAADDVWRWRQNLGCCAHLAPALMLVGHEHVLLADDDILPGSRALEHLLDTAATVKNRFSTISSVGRTFLLDRQPGQRYCGRSTATRRPDRPVVTHLTCQAHLVRADVWHHVLAFRTSLLRRRWTDPPQPPMLVSDLVKVHDDFLLCCGLQHGLHWPSYLTELETDDPEKCLVKQRLAGHSDATAVWRREGHFAERNRMVDLVLKAGWRPVDPAGGTASVSGKLIKIGDKYDPGYEIE